MQMSRSDEVIRKCFDVEDILIIIKIINMEKQYKAGSACAYPIQRARMHNTAVGASFTERNMSWPLMSIKDPTTDPELSDTDSLCNLPNVWVFMLSLQDADKRFVNTSTVNHWIHYVSLNVYVTIQNSAFCRLAPQKGRASTKNNSDQRNKKKQNK